MQSLHAMIYTDTQRYTLRGGVQARLLKLIQCDSSSIDRFSPTNCRHVWLHHSLNSFVIAVNIINIILSAIDMLLREFKN